MSTQEKAAIRCTFCNAGFRVGKSTIGKRVTCSKCQTVFTAAVATKSPGRVQASRRAQTSDSSQTSGRRQTPVGNKTPTRPPGTKRCDMCHEFVPEHEFDAHYKKHQGTEDDGQLSAYPTLPPEQRWKGDLSTVPQSYVHDICGAVTGMPEDIIRTYMVNPYFYGYSSFCCGCGSHISGKQLKWVETGETLYDHTKKLQAKLPEAKRYRNELIRNFVVISLIGGLILGLICGAAIYFIDGHLIGSLVATLLGCLGGFVLSFGGLYAMRGGI